MSSCTNSTRAAEQRWPALSKAERTASRTTCSGSAVESAIMALMPPVSAMNGTMAPRRSASACWIAQRGLVRTGEGDTPLMRVILDERLAEPSPPPGSRCSTSRGNAGFVQQLVARKAVIGVCSAGLASTALPAASAAATCPVKIASGKFHGDDAGEDAAPVQRQRVALARRPGQRHRAGEQAPRLRRVIAQEIDRLAHVALRVLQRLAGLAHDHRHEARLVALEQIGGAVQYLARAWRRPACSSRARALDRALDRRVGLRRRRDAHRADALAPIVRAGDEARGIAAGRRRAADDRAGRVDVVERVTHLGE